MQLHVHAVALLQAADDDFHVLLTRAGQQELLGLRIAIEAQRRILFQNLVHRVAHAVFVVARLGRNGVRDGWLGQHYSRIGDRRSFVGQRVAGQRFFELGDRPDIARVKFGHGLNRLTQKSADMRKTFGSAGAGVDQVRVILDDARHHLEIRNAAGKRIGYGLEHEGRDRFGILEIGRSTSFPFRVPFQGP